MRRIMPFLALVACCMSGTAALAAEPVRGRYSFSGVSFVVRAGALCDFDVTVASPVGEVAWTAWLDGDVLVRYHEHVVEQDAFSANGKSLTGEPFTFNIHLSFAESGELLESSAQGAIEKVRLPDGSWFIAAGRVDPFTGFALIPDRGTTPDVAGLCAALAPAACEAGWADCDGSAASGCETDVATSAQHCGACGVACAPGQVCVDGQCAAPRACSTTGWSSGASMPIAPGESQPFFQAQRLRTGKVLVFATDYPTTGAVLYDPATDSWSFTGSMAISRNWPSSAVLRSGQVLLAGGAWGIDAWDRSAELYDPATGAWTPTGSMAEARGGAPAVVLNSGKVLVAGGSNFNSIEGMSGLASAELFDPATGTWTAAGSLSLGRIGHSMVLLPSGKVLVAGGYNGMGGDWRTAEIFDPATGQWRTTAPTHASHQNGTATLLPSGLVLVVGDLWGDPTLAEIFDPATETWSLARPMPVGRSGHGAALLPSGQVLVAGGSGGLASTLLYDPPSDTWAEQPPLAQGRGGFALVSLPTGAALAIGGSPGSGNYLTSLEIFCSGSGP